MYILPGRSHCHRLIVNAFAHPVDGVLQSNDFVDDSLDEMFVMNLKMPMKMWATAIVWIECLIFVTKLLLTTLVFGRL